MSLQAAKVTYFFYITDCFIKKLFFMAPQNNISPNFFTLPLMSFGNTLKVLREYIEGTSGHP
jgi:hypothetical protein